MVIIESQIFSKLLTDYMSADDYREFQVFLAEHPQAGDVIQGTGGLRKVRWGTKGKGKSGGVRIIYYWQVSESQIYLLTLYAKNEMADLSVNERKMLKKMVEEWLK